MIASGNVNASADSGDVSSGSSNVSANSGNVSIGKNEVSANCSDGLDDEDGNCGSKLVADIDAASLQTSCKAFAKAVTFSYRWARSFAKALNTTRSTEGGKSGTF